MTLYPKGGNGSSSFKNKTYGLFVGDKDIIPCPRKIYNLVSVWSELKIYDLVSVCYQTQAELFLTKSNMVAL